jgi:xylulokinase
MTAVRDEMIVVGGGARSPVWRRIFADVFDCAIVKTNVDQQAATLGAAALALVGVGLWPDFEGVEALLAAEPPDRPDPAAKPVYEFALAAYRKAATQQREAADLLSKLRSLSQ